MLQEAGHEVTGLDTDLFAGCDFEVRKDIRELARADLQGFDAG
jgi:hypothetical protein